MSVRVVGLLNAGAVITCSIITLGRELALVVSCVLCPLIHDDEGGKRKRERRGKN